MISNADSDRDDAVTGKTIEEEGIDHPE